MMDSITKSCVIVFFIFINLLHFSAQNKIEKTYLINFIFLGIMQSMLQKL